MSKGNEKLSKGEKVSLILENNSRALKLKTTEVRHEAYRQYCEWIAAGKSKKSWTFVHDEISLTWETMEKYIEKYPLDFDPQKKKLAEAQSLATWEAMGIRMMMDKQAKSEPALFQMFMRNKFGWDKESQITHSFEPEARKLLKKFEGDTE